MKKTEVYNKQIKGNKNLILTNITVIICLVFITYRVVSPPTLNFNFVSLVLCVSWLGISLLARPKLFISILKEKK